MDLYFDFIIQYIKTAFLSAHVHFISFLKNFITFCQSERIYVSSCKTNLSPLVVKSFDLVCLWTCFGYLLLFVSFVDTAAAAAATATTTAATAAADALRRHKRQQVNVNMPHTRGQWSETTRLGELKQTHVFTFVIDQAAYRPSSQRACIFSRLNARADGKIV